MTGVWVVFEERKHDQELYFVNLYIIGVYAQKRAAEKEASVLNTRKGYNRWIEYWEVTP